VFRFRSLTHSSGHSFESKMLKERYDIPIAAQNKMKNRQEVDVSLTIVPGIAALPIQRIMLDELPKNRLILDIGAGGEGLVSRVGGKLVFAVDYRMSEILEARIHDPPANWFVSDARHLPFCRNSFDMATLWFSLGYMRNWTIKERVLSQVFETLRTSGELSILDSRIDCREEHFIFNALFTLPDGTTAKVGYGVHGNQEQTLDRVCSLLTKVGFDEIQTEDNNWWFRVHAIKGRNIHSFQNLKVQTDARSDSHSPGENQ
jgi:SAM-dependent methyltransferase